MIEEYDVSEPGSLFGIVVREPQLWKNSDANFRLEVAKDWAEIGYPMPTAEDTRRLSPKERVQQQGLLRSLHAHAMMNIKADTPSTEEPSASGLGSASRPDGRVPSMEMDIKRDPGGKLLNVKVFKNGKR